MASPAEPVTDALYKALSSPEPDPQVVHAAIEEIRQIASQNVIAVLGAQITEMKAGFSEVNSRIDTLGEGGLARDLAAHRSAGRSYLWPALQGPYCRPWLGTTLSQMGVQTQ